MRADDQAGAHRSHQCLHWRALQGKMAAQRERCDSEAEQEQTTDAAMPMTIAGDQVRQAEHQRSAEKERLEFRSSNPAGITGNGENQWP
jgi:hypothetical protein